MRTLTGKLNGNFDQKFSRKFNKNLDEKGRLLRKDIKTRRWQAEKGWGK